MTQDQKNHDQDTEKALSEGTSTDESQIPTTQNPTAASQEESTHAEADITSNNSSTHQQADKNKQRIDQKKPKLLKIVGIIALILILGLIAFGLWKSYQPKEIELQGRVEADTVYVSTKVPSRIEEIYVHEGQRIIKGQELVRLYSPEVDAKKQQALGLLQSALALQSTAERGSQEENVATLYANWQSLKAQEQLAKTTYQRGENLFKEGVISRQRRDEMHAAAISATELTEAAHQQYLRAQRGSTPQQKSSADAQVQIAQAAVAEANALEAETKLLAPINGTVSKTYGKVSELVVIGVPVVSIIQDDHLKVSFNVREDQYAQVYQAKTIQGFIPALNKIAIFKIKNIDVEGEFATLKTTRQTGGYDIRSFKVHVVPVQALPDLKVGMSVLFKVKETN
ncbi:HlyD family secretion protein [Acinetobacter sp. ANC 4648]|uniref:HlyD family secretion protein n=1 Tax=Acinetobacter sp. ANC 4648 TaxID=1977875 RepID=UPI000A341241|nr:efflux RND transporter periplasmic adaptor subunit [Acinetobacter sp. ANC 4648]OTG83667.1 RND transporter [Acinetobacter sp. ANC 4648]